MLAIFTLYYYWPSGLVAVFVIMEVLCSNLSVKTFYLFFLPREEKNKRKKVTMPRIEPRTFTSVEH